jgi:hypothetical protein
MNAQGMAWRRWRGRRVTYRGGYLKVLRGLLSGPAGEASCWDTKENIGGSLFLRRQINVKLEGNGDG